MSSPCSSVPLRFVVDICRLLRDAELFQTKLGKLEGSEKVGQLLQRIATNKVVAKSKVSVEKPVSKLVEKTTQKPTEPSGKPSEVVRHNSTDSPQEGPIETLIDNADSKGVEQPTVEAMNGAPNGSSHNSDEVIGRELLSSDAEKTAEQIGGGLDVGQDGIKPSTGQALDDTEE